MRALALGLGLAFAGCTGVYDAVDKLTGGPEQRAARAAADEVKCRELGFKPGTDGYGNCRLKLDEIRAIKNAADQNAAAVRQAGDNKEGMSLLCKDAIGRGDRGGTFVHC